MVQTHKAEGNTIEVYDRDEDGRLSKATNEGLPKVADGIGLEGVAAS
ncbi:hypothetical protein ACI2KV_16460 [Micromonospora chokoriensis]